MLYGIQILDKFPPNKTHAAGGVGRAGETVKLLGCLNCLGPQLMRRRYARSIWTKDMIYKQFGVKFVTTFFRNRRLNTRQNAPNAVDTIAGHVEKLARIAYVSIAAMSL